MHDPEEYHRVRRSYRRYARDPRKRRSWASDNAGNQAIRAELVELTFAVEGAAICAARELLDVGCGTGWWLESLAARPAVAAALHGIEILPERAAVAQRRVPDAIVTVGDARALPYSDHRFDLVSLFTVLSSLSGPEDIAAALRQARRVLRPGGSILVWEPRLPNPLNRSTILVTRRMLRGALPGCQIQSRSVTLLPPLARRLGGSTRVAYPRLARVPWLRSHRLYSVR